MTDKKLKELIKDCAENGKISKGVLEVKRSIQKNKALLVIMTKDVDQEQIVQLINKLAKINNIPLIKQLSKNELGKLIDIGTICSTIAITQKGRLVKSFVKLLFSVSEKKPLNWITFLPIVLEKQKGLCFPTSLKDIQEVKWQRKNNHWETNVKFTAKAKKPMRKGIAFDGRG